MATAAILNLIFCRFWSHDLLLVAADDITAKFQLSMSIGGWFIVVFAKIQNGGRRHFEFYFCSIFWHACMFDFKRNTHAKFRANTCNNKQAMSDKLI